MAESHPHFLHVNNVAFHKRARGQRGRAFARRRFNDESADSCAGLGAISGDWLQKPDTECLASGNLLARGGAFCAARADEKRQHGQDTRSKMRRNSGAEHFRLSWAQECCRLPLNIHLDFSINYQRVCGVYNELGDFGCYILHIAPHKVISHQKSSRPIRFLRRESCSWHVCRERMPP